MTSFLYAIATTFFIASSVISAVCAKPSDTADTDASIFDPPYPVGAFISRPEVLELLDQVSPEGDCQKSGPLVLACLIQAIAQPGTLEPPTGVLRNPFNLRVSEVIRNTITKDLENFRTSASLEPTQMLNPDFLTHPGSRLELVGIINRMDRQFIRDLVPGAEQHQRCGEISVIYRFAYSLTNSTVTSRLPVTLNLVCPCRDDGGGEIV